MEHKVGIIGVGFVGMAVSTGLGLVADIREYDKYKDTESLDSVVHNSDILFLCLPTPMDEEDRCDTSIITQVAYEIDEISETSKAIVLKSTVPPGTTQAYSNKFENHSWFFNPEFLTERNYINDFLEQDRIFLGLTKQADFEHVKLIEDLYEQFTESQQKKAVIKFTESEEAEMLKYVSNTFLATKVTFFNEIYEICKNSDIDYEKVIHYIKLDKRIGKTHLQVPGPDGDFGFGGSCFPKDLCALIAFAEDNDVDPLVLSSVWSKNLLVRGEYEWEELPQVNGRYEKE